MDAGPTVGATAFNSLSRDHCRFKQIAEECDQVLLSTPSLGITASTYSCGKWTLTVGTFNSLSRDHSIGICLQCREVVEPVFQLPLSGSRLAGLRRRLHQRMAYFQLPLSGSRIRSLTAIRITSALSTPSLGITFAIALVAVLLIMLSTPSLGITFCRVDKLTISQY